MRTHNGTIYRWNRACYGVSPNGKRTCASSCACCSSGPTIADEVANAALWLGLMSEPMHTVEDISTRVVLPMRAQPHGAREGSARLTWLDGEELLAQNPLFDKMLPWRSRACTGKDR
jgi:hypothetical protein